EWNNQRRAHAQLYRELLGGKANLTLPKEASYAKHVYHIFAVRVPGRAAVLAELARKGVTGGIHYPIPVHLQEAYQDLGLVRGSFPVSERCATEFLSLPMYPELTPDQIRHVSASLLEVLESQGASGDRSRQPVNARHS